MASWERVSEIQSVKETWPAEQALDECMQSCVSGSLCAASTSACRVDITLPSVCMYCDIFLEVMCVSSSETLDRQSFDVQPVHLRSVCAADLH